jgi:peptide/nickel transport system ATP-binding protein
VLALLKQLVTDMSMALLFISHDLAVVNSIAERIVVMRQGVIVERGEAGAVLAAPQHDYTKSLVAAAAAFEDALAGQS